MVRAGLALKDEGMKKDELRMTCGAASLRVCRAAALASLSMSDDASQKFA